MMHGKPTGVEIERFTPFERSAHWTNAIAFVVLALSGITMAFGKFFMQPIIGDTLFGWITYLLKNVHNFAGPLFAVSLTVVFVTFLKDNLPSKEDLTWLLKGGGLLSGHEVPSHRFNAGEKLVFWGGRVCARFGGGGFGLCARQNHSFPCVRTQHHANGTHGSRRGHALDDDDVHRPHLHGHHRYGRCLQSHANRLCGRGVG